MVDGAELPFAAVWRPRLLGGAFGEPVEIRIFAEPLTPAVAETKYGVAGFDRPHLAFFDPEQCEGLKEDDEVAWDGMSLTVRAVKRYDFADVRTLEAVITGRTRGR